jgi:hypothetical protein
VRYLFLLIGMGCPASQDPCDTVEGSQASYEAGYQDGARCAAYDNPHEGLSEDTGDTDESSEGDADSDSNACLWSAYDEGFSVGRSGADCSAGLD